MVYLRTVITLILSSSARLRLKTLSSDRSDLKASVNCSHIFREIVFNSTNCTCNYCSDYNMNQLGSVDAFCNLF